MLRYSGPDVSAYQHPDEEAIDWKRVAAEGHRRAWIKCSESVDYSNPWTRVDAVSARAAGISVGFYHVLDPEAEAAAQVDLIMRTVDGLPRDFGIALDLEATYGTDWSLWSTITPEALKAFPESVEKRWVYSSTWFYESVPGIPWGAEIWLAQWGSMPRRHLTCWQYATNQYVPGIPESVDLNRWYW